MSIKTLKYIFVTTVCIALVSGCSRPDSIKTTETMLSEKVIVQEAHVTDGQFLTSKGIEAVLLIFIWIAMIRVLILEDSIRMYM